MTIPPTTRSSRYSRKRPKQEEVTNLSDDSPTIPLHKRPNQEEVIGRLLITLLFLIKYQYLCFSA